MSIRLSEFISDSWVVISGLRILMIYDASLEIIPAPGTDPVHVFLTKNGKWEGCYCNTSKVLLKCDERFRLLFQRNYYQRIFFTCFAKIVWRWCQWMFFVCSPFLSSFHFPHSLSLPRGWSFRLKLSHCLVKTNLTEQQGFNFFPSLIWKLYPLLQQHKSISSISCCC